MNNRWAFVPNLKRPGVVVFVCALAIYGATSYAGIRSPDSEVVFELCDALRMRGSLAVDNTYTYQGFGVSSGRGGHRYAIFGPLESFACVPFLFAADAIDRTGWYQSLDYLPASFYIKDSLLHYLLNQSIETNRVEHARRSLVAWWMGSLFGALGVLFFFRLARTLAGGRLRAPLIVTALYGTGTIAWPYANTFFSEPLATWLVLAALERLVCFRDAEPDPHPITAGVALGLAVCAHITAILFVPFFAMLLPRRPAPTRAWLRPVALDWRRVLRFAGGLAGPFLLLGLYNLVRFGDPFETGRGIGRVYATWVMPFHGLWELLVGPCKGLVVFAPAVLFGLVAWPRFHRLHPRLSATIAAAALFRWLFIAARSDWHGGFSLGPRFLVMLLPFLLLPIVPWLDESITQGRRGLVAVALAVGLACTVQQLLFVIGEVFSYLFYFKINMNLRGIYIIKDDVIYTDWTYSPLRHILDSKRGPFLLHDIPMSNMSLWLCLSGVAALVYALAAVRLLRTPPR